MEDSNWRKQAESTFLKNNLCKKCSIPESTMLKHDQMIVLSFYWKGVIFKFIFWPSGTISINNL